MLEALLQALIIATVTPIVAVLAYIEYNKITNPPAPPVFSDSDSPRHVENALKLKQVTGVIDRADLNHPNQDVEMIRAILDPYHEHPTRD